jgi:hypothetical protein
MTATRFDETICRLFEAQNAEVRASILLVENAATLHPAAGPSLLPAYCALLEGAAVGMNRGRDRQCVRRRPAQDS